MIAQVLSGLRFFIAQPIDRSVRLRIVCWDAKSGPRHDRSMSSGRTVGCWVADDVERVGWVHSRSRRQAYAGLVPDEALARVTPAEQVGVWRARIARLPERHVALVITQAGGVIGFALGQFDAQSGAQLNAIHVLPEQQGTGAGQELMDSVIATFGDWGVTDAHLHVIEGNERAQAFYRRTGWLLRGPAGSHQVGGALVSILEYRLVIA